ncbi:uncharacterized protein LOC114798327 isoform X2 [Denticeps clupeoides]|uniref:uncharacterized protein LOC114798327 isoform X2 n=1 Tax=Denticeps clupeoides TaxID=299321 RepID=UPI0010A3C079|nr:uncharacterized protein LOC114798327 isoform X2 [Denticeps clupeoides]
MGCADAVASSSGRNAMADGRLAGANTPPSSEPGGGHHGWTHGDRVASGTAGERPGCRATSATFQALLASSWTSAKLHRSIFETRIGLSSRFYTEPSRTENSQLKLPFTHHLPQGEFYTNPPLRLQLGSNVEPKWRCAGQVEPEREAPQSAGPPELCVWSHGGGFGAHGTSHMLRGRMESLAQEAEERVSGAFRSGLAQGCFSCANQSEAAAHRRRSPEEGKNAERRFDAGNGDPSQEDGLADVEKEKRPKGHEIYSPCPAVETEERFMALYRFHLLMRCLRTWVQQHRRLRATRLWHRRRVLSRVLFAMRWAAVGCHKQATLLLARSFHHWKVRVKSRQDLCTIADRCRDENVEALRWRLTPRGHTVVVRTAYCAWRRHAQGKQLCRVALIHCHMNLLCKHWLQWRRACVRQQQWQRVELQSTQHRERLLQLWDLTDWRPACRRQHQASQKHKYRMSMLEGAWHEWDAHVERRRWGRLKEAQESADLYGRGTLLHHPLLWRESVDRRQVEGDQQRNIVRKAMNRWHHFSHLRVVERLGSSIEQVFRRRRLLATFGRWCELRTRAQVERRLVEDVCLLRKGKMLWAAFGLWRRVLRVKRGAVCLREKICLSKLSHCVRGWRCVVERRAALLHWCRRREGTTARATLQIWRKALVLRSQHKRSLRFFLRSRRPALLHGGNVQGWRGDLLSARFRAQASLDELCDVILLQKALHTWRKQTLNIRKARLCSVAHEQERLRAALVCWHTLAHAAQTDRILRFRCRLAQLSSSSSSSALHCSSSLAVSQEKTVGATQQSWSDGSHRRVQDCPLLVSSPLNHPLANVCVANEATGVLCVRHNSEHADSPRLKAVAVRALARMMRPTLSTTFSRWRRLVNECREMNCQAEIHRDVRTRTRLRVVFLVWRREMLKYRRATRHRAIVLLLSSVHAWRRHVCEMKRRTYLQQSFELFHRTSLLTCSFTAWHSKLSLKCDGEKENQLMLKGAWFQRSGDSLRVQSSYRLWKARVQQIQAVHDFYIKTLISRVFVAWEVCVQSRLSAQAQLRKRVYGTVFSWWKTSTAQHQLANHWRTHTRRTHATLCLRHWSAYTQNALSVRLVLHELVEVRKRRMKIGVLLIWFEAFENSQRAQHAHRLSLLKRCVQQWLSQSQKTALMEAIQRSRAIKSLQTSLCTWRRRLRTQATNLRAAVGRWRQVVLERRAERLHTSRVQLATLMRWKSVLVGLRRRRQSTLTAAGVWRQRALHIRGLQERAEGFHQSSLKRLWFLCWRDAHQNSLNSLCFHDMMLCRRVLLGWNKFTEASHRNQYKEAWFQCIREQRLTDACFALWHSRLLQAVLRQSALDLHLFQHNVHLKACSMQWWRVASRGQALLKRLNKGLLLKCFKVWRERAEESRTNQERRWAQAVLSSWMLWAKEHRAQRLMGEAMHFWMEGRRASRAFHQWHRAQKLHVEATRHGEAHLLFRAFQAWRTVVMENKRLCQNVQTRMCILHTRAAFSKWRRAAISQHALHMFVVKVKVAERQRLLAAAFKAWREKLCSCQRQSEHLCRKFFQRWLQEVQRRRLEREGDREFILGWRYLKIWHETAQERGSGRRLTQQYWERWKNRAAASLILSTMHNHSVLQKAWIIWRKRYIRCQVAETCAANVKRDLLAEVFSVWRKRSSLSSVHLLQCVTEPADGKWSC